MAEGLFVPRDRVLIVVDIGRLDLTLLIAVVFGEEGSAGFEIRRGVEPSGVALLEACMRQRDDVRVECWRLGMHVGAQFGIAEAFVPFFLFLVVFEQSYIAARKEEAQS